jgi:hypothetical protein
MLELLDGARQAARDMENHHDQEVIQNEME